MDDVSVLDERDRTSDLGLWDDVADDETVGAGWGGVDLGG